MSMNDYAFHNYEFCSTTFSCDYILLFLKNSRMICNSLMIMHNSYIWHNQRSTLIHIYIQIVCNTQQSCLGMVYVRSSFNYNILTRIISLLKHSLAVISRHVKVSLFHPINSFYL